MTDFERMDRRIIQHRPHNVFVCSISFSHKRYPNAARVQTFTTQSHVGPLDKSPSMTVVHRPSSTYSHTPTLQAFHLLDTAFSFPDVGEFLQFVKRQVRSGIGTDAKHAVLDRF